MSYLLHKKSVSKRKIVLFKKKFTVLKNPQKITPQKNTFLVGCFRWVFLGGFSIANPANPGKVLE
jgi:hypothetical protein